MQRHIATYHHTYLLDNQPPVANVVSPELHSELPRMCISYSAHVAHTIHTIACHPIVTKYKFSRIELKS